MDTFLHYFFTRLYNGQSKAELTHVEINSSLLCARAATSREARFFFPEFRSDLCLISSQTSIRYIQVL